MSIKKRIAEFLTLQPAELTPITLDYLQDKYFIEMTIGTMRAECKGIELALDSWRNHTPEQLSEMCVKYARMKRVLKMWDERFPA